MISLSAVGLAHTLFGATICFGFVLKLLCAYFALRFPLFDKLNNGCARDRSQMRTELSRLVYQASKLISRLLTNLFQMAKISNASRFKL